MNKLLYLVALALTSAIFICLLFVIRDIQNTNDRLCTAQYDKKCVVMLD